MSSAFRSGQFHTGHRSLGSGQILVLLAALLAALLVWIVLPDIVVVFNDDFGYLRSVVATLQHGRPWTDDWLEPWAASLAVISGSIFRATGSFFLATYGLQIAMCGLSFWSMATLFARRSIPAVAAIAITFVVLFSPTLLAKFVEYTALAIYLPLFLLALQFSERRWWAGFFVVWAIAVTSRQSAMAWLALPGFAAIESLRPGPDKSRNKAIVPIIVCLGGVAVYILVARLMNETHAQYVMTSAMWRGLTLGPVLIHLVLGMVIFIASAGCAGFAIRAFCTCQSSLGRSRWSRIGCVTAAGTVLGLLIVDPRTFIGFDHPFYLGRTGQIYLTLLCALGAAGWLFGGFRLQASHVVCAAGSALLVSLRGAIYDYYLIDVVLLGVFSVFPKGAATDEGWLQARGLRLGLAISACGACLSLACFELHFIGKEKRILDRYAEVIRLCEPALRTGQIAPSELSVAPFGYYGWHLYPYYIEHDGANGGYIADFEKYLARDSLVVSFLKTSNMGEIRQSHETTTQEGVLATGFAPVGFRGEFIFTLRRTQNAKAASLVMDLSSYRLAPYPLNDSEWRRLIDGKLH